MASNGESRKPGDGRGSGWNDPPSSRYSSSPRGSLPRKRFPHPLQANGTPPGNSDLLNPVASLPSSKLASSNDVSPSVQLFPPLHGTDPASYTAPLIIPTLSGSSIEGSVATNPVTSASIAVKTSSSEADVDVPEFEDDEQMFHYVVTRLQRALKDCQHTADARAAEEMLKKVNVFSDMWKNGKISYPVKSTMARLATAIHKRQCEMAHDLLMSLMVDHVSEVSRWLVGVKRLVQEVQSVEAPLSPSSDCHSDIKPLPLCDVEPSLVAAECSDSQSADATVTLPDAGSNTDSAAVSNDTLFTVMSSLGACDLSSETLCSTSICRENVGDAEADKKPVSCANDRVSSSCDVADVLPTRETQSPCVSSDDTLTSADSVTVDS